MLHSFDPRIMIHSSQAIWHADPNFEAFVEDLLSQTKPKRWVETGTHMGWTSHWLAEKHPEILIDTVEIDPDYHRLSSENLSGFENVTTNLSSSIPYFERRLPEIKDDLNVFWLDAHWGAHSPLHEECAMVSKLSRYVVLIDDFYCDSPDFEGDWLFHLTDHSVKLTHEYVADVLGPRCYRPAYESKPGYKGYGLFLRNVDYSPLPFMKLDVIRGT